MPVTHTPLEDVLENYRCYLSRNGDLTSHYAQYMKRVKTDPKAAEAEAIVFSWLRAEKRNPHIHEDTATGGPDFRCEPASDNPFMVEVTSLDSEMVSKRSGLPVEASNSGGGAAIAADQSLWEARRILAPICAVVMVRTNSNQPVIVLCDPNPLPSNFLLCPCQHLVT